ASRLPPVVLVPLPCSEPAIVSGRSPQTQCSPLPGPNRAHLPYESENAVQSRHPFALPRHAPERGRGEPAPQSLSTMVRVFVVVAPRVALTGVPSVMTTVSL